MKKFPIAVLALAYMTSLQAQSSSSNKTVAPAKKPAATVSPAKTATAATRPATPTVITLKNEMDSVSYALGVSLASYYKAPVKCLKKAILK